MPAKRHLDDQQFHFEGFSTPNGTFVPDDLFDLLAPRLTEAELRVVLYIIRRTFGFGKNSDAISLKQLTEGITTRDGRILDNGTGMSRKGVIAGIKGLLDKGIINVEKREDERGENHINIYTLRFRDGVVTSGNYRSNLNTLPVVTGGYPQETVLQEPVEQQLPLPGSNSTEARRRPSVVVDNDPAWGRPDLYEGLRDLGVHHLTAGKLLRQYDHAEIEILVGFVSQRLQQGWTPQESAAAWLVSAIRDHYEPPSYFKSPAVQAETKVKLAEQRSLQIEAERAATQEVEAEFSRQRAGKLLTLGIEQNVDKIWQEVQCLLREQGQWSVAMSMCFLKSVEGDLAILLVPAAVGKRLASHQPAIAEALQQVTQRSLRLILHEMRT